MKYTFNANAVGSKYKVVQGSAHLVKIVLYQRESIYTVEAGNRSYDIKGLVDIAPSRSGILITYFMSCTELQWQRDATCIIIMGCPTAISNKE